MNSHLILIFYLIGLFLCAGLLRLLLFSHQSKKIKSIKTSGKFGSASFAESHDLKKFIEEEGSVFGKDHEGNILKYPLKNRTIISSPGGGKSAAIAIPSLLTEDRGMFINDVRGELWAVTSRFRLNGFGRHRKVIAVDPFRILQQPEFQANKPRELSKVWTLNPLDYISDDILQRQRDINGLVSSLVIREGKQHTHWDDNAEILLGGMIDFILKTEKTDNIHLVTLYQHFIKDENSINYLLKEMYESGGMAQAAAAQLLKTDKEERGSIYSSTFRQIKWLMDENMQTTFKQSNFDLRDFLKGDMDIFVVLPEDQIIFHQRVFRMLFATVTNLISKTSPTELPNKEILFLLDELGQLGYCKDVERAIEILRARRSVIWAFFQSLGQIKLYEKPDIFLNAKIKQIFEIDDVETMQWLQALIGKETILLESKSHNTSDSKQKMQHWGGSVSKGDSENIQETGVDLIPLNEIRELPGDEQLVIIRGEKIIRCKKLLYYEEQYFERKLDKNPYLVGINKQG